MGSGTRSRRHRMLAVEPLEPRILLSGPAAQLAFVRPPTNAYAASAIAPAVTVDVEDANGNVVTSDSSTITLAVATGRGPAGAILGGTLSQRVIGGVATFNDLTLNTAGTYTLVASDAKDGLSGTPSTPLTVAAADSEPLLYASDDNGLLYTLNAKTGSVHIIGPMGVDMFDIAMSPSGQLYGVDCTGFFISTSSLYEINRNTAAVTMIGPVGASLNALVFGPNGTLYGAGSGLYTINTITGSGTEVGDLSGLSSAGDLVFDTAGKLYLSTTTDMLALVNPSTGAASVIGPLGFHNVFGMAYGPNGTLYGMSDSSDDVFSINTSTGQGTLTASFAGEGVQGCNGAASYVTGPADQLVFAQPQSTGQAGGPITDASGNPVTVEVEDANGNLVITDNSSVTVTLNTGTFGDGNKSETVAVVNGEATFSGLKINQAGSYTLKATDGEVPSSAPTSYVTITPGPAARLAFLQPQSTGQAGVPITDSGGNPVTVEVEDAYNNVVTTDNSSVTVTLSTGTFSNPGANGASETEAAVNGAATFSNLRINRAGAYTLTAADSEAPASEPTSSITITPGPAVQLAFVQPQSTGQAGGPITDINGNPVTVDVEDVYKNVVTADNSSVTVALNTGTFSNPEASGTSETVAVVNGQAAFSDLTINEVGTYTLRATDSEVLLSAPTSALTITPGPATQLAFVQPQLMGLIGGLVTDIAGNPVAVQVEDAYNNVVTSDSSSVTVTLNAGTFSNPEASGPSETAATAEGMATFSDLSISVGGTYALQATDGTLTPATSASFNVVPAAVQDHLAFIQQPTDLTAGNRMTPAVAIAIENSANAIVTSDDTEVTITLDSGNAVVAGTWTVVAPNGRATFGNISVSAAGTYTLQATDGTDAPVTSQSFTVNGTTPISPLAAAIQNLQQAVSAYQQEAIAVIAQGDAYLLQYFADNTSAGSNAVSLGLTMASAVGTAAAGGIASTVAQELAPKVTQAALSVLSDLPGDLMQDIELSGAQWVLNSLSPLLQSGNSSYTVQQWQTVIQKQLTSQAWLGGILAETSNLGNEIVNELPVTTSPSFPLNAVINTLNVLTTEITQLTPVWGTPDEQEVAWSVPGAPLLPPVSIQGNSTSENLDPVLLGATSEIAQSLPTIAAGAGVVSTINMSVSIATAAWTDGGAVAKAVLLASGPGEAPAEAVYWGGMGFLNALGGVTTMADIVSNSYAEFEHFSALESLRSEVSLIHDWFEVLGQQIVSLANTPQSNYSTGLTVGSLYIPNVTGGWFNEEAAVTATVPITENLDYPGEAIGLLYVYTSNGALVEQAASSGGITSISPGGQATLSFTFDVPDGALFYSEDYNARCTVIDTTGVVVERDATFQASSPLTTTVDNLGQTILDGTLTAGQDVGTWVQTASNAVTAEFILGSPGSDMDLQVYDSAGDHVGYNYATGQVDLGIPGAQYNAGSAGTPQSIELPVSQNSNYYVEVVGLQTEGAESYDVVMNSYAQHPATLSVSPNPIVANAPAGGDVEFAVGLGEIGDQQDLTGVQVSISNLTGPDGSVIPSTAISFNAPPATIAAGTQTDASYSLVAPAVTGAYDGSIEVTSSGGDYTVPVEIDVSGPSQLGFSTQPANGLAGKTISPAVTVDVEDAGGNVVPDDKSDVTLAISSGTITGTLTEQAVNGAATFNDLSLPAGGIYTLTASDGTLTPNASASFGVTTIGLAGTWQWAGALSNGTFTLDNQGDVSGSIQNNDGALLAVTGNYAVNAQGQVTMACEDSSGNPYTWAGAVNAAHDVVTLAQTSFSGESTGQGVMVLSGTGSFSDADLSGSWGLVTSDGSNGWLSFDGKGGITSGYAVWGTTDDTGVVLSGSSYAVSADGLVTMTVNLRDNPGGQEETRVIEGALSASGDFIAASANYNPDNPANPTLNTMIKHTATFGTSDLSGVWNITADETTGTVIFNGAGKILPSTYSDGNGTYSMSGTYTVAATGQVTAKVTTNEPGHTTMKLTGYLDSAGDTLAMDQLTNNTTDSDVFYILTNPSSTDIAAQIGKVTIPNLGIPGDKGSVSVVVTNDGQIPAGGTGNISLFLCDSDTETSGETLLGTLTNQKVALAYDHSQTYTFSSVQLPASLPAGTYYLQADVSAKLTNPAESAQNFLSAPSAPVSVVWEFGNVGTQKNVVLNLTEADGTLATFSLSGAGMGDVTVSGSEWDLTVTGTAVKSTVTITTKAPTKSASGLLGLDDITVSGALGTFSATGVDLAGAMTVSGSLGTLNLGNSGGKSPVGGNVLAGASVNVGRIGTLRVGGSFEGTSAAGITVNAAAITTLKVTGAMNYTQLLTTGNIGSVSLGEMENSDMFAGVATGVTSLPATAADFSSEADSIKSITITGGSTAAESFINWNIAAWTIGTLKLGFPDGSNGGIPFGVACNKYTTLSFRNSSGKLTTWKYPQSGTFAAGDEVVNIITS